MLTSIEIVNNQKSPLSYLPDVFENGTIFEFKPGINIIIGPNGTGKSTIIKLIASYLLCSKTLYSQVPNQILQFPNIFNLSSLEDSDSVLDGVKVHHDFNSVCFNYTPSISMQSETPLYNINNFRNFYNGLYKSTGESHMSALDILIQTMFSTEIDKSFPYNDLKYFGEKDNGRHKERMKNLVKYYKENTCIEDIDYANDFEFTILMDEPDRNLDIYNIETLYNMFSIKKEMTQLILVLHNPALIYKLSKLDHINWIQTKHHYLNKVIKFFKD